MKRLLGCLFLVAFSLYSQGIDSPIVKLAIPGTWEQHPEWIGNAAKQGPSSDPGRQAFYQPESGELADVGQNSAWNDDEADKVVQSLSEIKPNESGVPQPEFQRILVKTYFPHPDSYLAENLIRLRNGEQPRPVWDLKGIKGDVRSFYSSQLSPGEGSNKSGTNVMIYEKWTPTRLIRAEKRRIDTAGAILAELETEEPVDRKVADKFGMPSDIAGQKTRFCYVVYSGSGFVRGGSQITFVWAGPSNSETNSQTILDLLVASASQPR